MNKVDYVELIKAQQRRKHEEHERMEQNVFELEESLSIAKQRLYWGF